MHRKGFLEAERINVSFPSSPTSPHEMLCWIHLTYSVCRMSCHDVLRSSLLHSGSLRVSFCLTHIMMVFALEKLRKLPIKLLIISRLFHTARRRRRLKSKNKDINWIKWLAFLSAQTRNWSNHSQVGCCLMIPWLIHKKHNNRERSNKTYNNDCSEEFHTVSNGKMHMSFHQPFRAELLTSIVEWFSCVVDKNSTTIVFNFVEASKPQWHDSTLSTVHFFRTWKHTNRSSVQLERRWIRKHSFFPQFCNRESSILLLTALALDERQSSSFCVASYFFY